jgi:mannose/fructose/N-acetylgalactosamine-specific phosphotransferase system component IIB
VDQAVQAVAAQMMEIELVVLEQLIKVMLEDKAGIQIVFLVVVAVLDLLEKVAKVHPTYQVGMDCK